MKLLIVESPTKAKNIKQYLDADYVIFATKGHLYETNIKNNKKNNNYEYGINLNTWEPDIVQITQKQKEIKELKKLIQNADKIILATDYDREGESIAYWILKKLLPNYLKNKNECRAIFSEITKKAILKSINDLKKIDIGLIHSQKARNIYDILIGLNISKELRYHYHSKSAGRVQSVALKMISDLDSKIKNFVPEKYFEIKLKINDKYELNSKKFNDKKIINDVILKAKSAKIINFDSKIKKYFPSNLFKTSTLIQAAFNKYGYSTQKIMQLAQQLYEGIKINNKIYSLITYIRTDSIRINDEMKTKIQKFLVKKNLLNEKYDGPKNIKKINVQDAHECIRPIYLEDELNLNLLKQKLNSQQFNLYNLIYSSTLAHFSKPIIKENYNIKFQLDNTNINFIYKLSKLVDSGFGELPFFKNEITKDLINETPSDFKINNVFKNLKFICSTKFTLPPSRFNHSSLIKQLDFNGIGRPSTYGTIIQKLKKWNYVIEENKQLKTTIRGYYTNKILQKNYHTIFNINFTAEMEKYLDKIAFNDIVYDEHLKKIYKKIHNLVDLANKNYIPNNNKNIKAFKLIDEKCPKCDSNLYLAHSLKRNNDFKACEHYLSKDKNETNSKCNYTESLNTFISKLVNKKCEKCNSELVTRQNRRTNEIFIGCKSFPKCKNIINCKKDNKLKELIKKLYT